MTDEILTHRSPGDERNDKTTIERNRYWYDVAWMDGEEFHSESIDDGITDEALIAVLIDRLERACEPDNYWGDEHAIAGTLRHALDMKKNALKRARQAEAAK